MLRWANSHVEACSVTFLPLYQFLPCLLCSVSSVGLQQVRLRGSAGCYDPCGATRGAVKAFWSGSARVTSCRGKQRSDETLESNVR